MLKPRGREDKYNNRENKQAAERTESGTLAWSVDDSRSRGVSGGPGLQVSLWVVACI